jgi:anti-sigma regulatory factor (Ser/Thr protein kinase)
VLAVNEIATNAVLYGSPVAQLQLRVDGQAMAVAEVRDSGHWQPGPGPPPPGRGGRGLPLARLVCDEVEIRCGRSGTVVILRMSLPERGRAGGAVQARR